MVGILAESWVGRHSDIVVAVAVLAGAVILLFILDRYVDSRLHRVLDTQDIGAKYNTRLRFAWRCLQAGIAVVAIAVALDQFTDLSGLASTLLASSAIATLIIGFAARGSIANAVAGISLAVSQPLRIGDLVTFDGETGIVEDIRLTSTWLRTLSDARIVIPNELLTSGLLRNDSIGSATVAVEVSIWLAPDIDTTAAIEAVETLAGVRGRIAESHPEGNLRLLVMGSPGLARDRMKLEGELRRDALAALREAGVR